MGNTIAVLASAIDCERYSPRAVIRVRSPQTRSTNPHTPCRQPAEIGRKSRMNKTSRMLLEPDQPVRHSKSANNKDTTPVSRNAEEKKMNTRQSRPVRSREGIRLAAGETTGSEESDGVVALTIDG